MPRAQPGRPRGPLSVIVERAIDMAAGLAFQRVQKDDSNRSFVPSTIPHGGFTEIGEALSSIYRQLEEIYDTANPVLDSGPNTRKPTLHQANFMSTIPEMELLEKRSVIKFKTDDDYPPHLDHTREFRLKCSVPERRIFNHKRLRQILPALCYKQYAYAKHNIPFIGDIASIMINDFKEAKSIKDVFQNNQNLRREKIRLYAQKNVGDRSDWYTDAVFAQQQFTGANPTTIECASPAWIKQFLNTARAQVEECVDLTRVKCLQKIIDRLSAADKGLHYNRPFYIQDCSYFRGAIGLASSSERCNTTIFVNAPDGNRYACASVSLFYLYPGGKLHPVAIVIDYKGSTRNLNLDNSVVLFNKRADPEDTVDQYNDWPWRYAKTCAQSADWLRHEIAVHLVNTHLVEEVVIIASHRQLPTDNLLYRLLQPHWSKTLRLNSLARDFLVPKIIVPIIGFTEEQTLEFAKDAYRRFNWTELYAPRDLERRGFPVGDLDSWRFHNYAYARNIYAMWGVLRTYVSSFLANGGDGYCTDDRVKRDKHVQAWAAEIRKHLSSFPIVESLEDLINAATMCIHIAAPQHTAINYLQQYYQSFVINKPPALCAELPVTLDALLSYTEADLLKALPVNRPQQWLLASHVPNLLSETVSSDQSLFAYAVSAWRTARDKREEALQRAAEDLCRSLCELGNCKDPRDHTKIKKGLFQRHSDDLDDHDQTPYNVLDPVVTAVSILI